MADKEETKPAEEPSQPDAKRSKADIPTETTSAPQDGRATETDKSKESAKTLFGAKSSLKPTGLLSGWGSSKNGSSSSTLSWGSSKGSSSGNKTLPAPSSSGFGKLAQASSSSGFGATAIDTASARGFAAVAKAGDDFGSDKASAEGNPASSNKVEGGSILKAVTVSQPAVKLEKDEDLITGEEDEEKVHQMLVKLYCLSTQGKTSEWKERGKGPISLNDYRDKDSKPMSRLVMRNETKQLILNAPLATALKPTKTSEKVIHCLCSKAGFKHFNHQIAFEQLIQITLFNHVPDVHVKEEGKAFEPKPRAYLIKAGERSIVQLDKLFRLLNERITTPAPKTTDPTETPEKPDKATSS
eukprot:TRINITY_DN10323_c0_g1_i3.p1 TRINITY_DN10323_c0_g1~~TRINITY_DN10323_c0_g1_i3.p1  ORF type:complete len:371 (+),score=77.09 TRINITY_DN10323_c0_g1_i3:48-1115(+)